MATTKLVAPYLLLPLGPVELGGGSAVHRSAAEAHVDVSGPLQLEGSVEAVLLKAEWCSSVALAEQAGSPFAAAEGWTSGHRDHDAAAERWSVEVVFVGVLAAEQCQRAAWEGPRAGAAV